MKTQLVSTRRIFEVCKVPTLPLVTCCKVLREIAVIQKSKTRSPLNGTHEPIRLKWVRKYKKIDLFNVIFTNKYHSTLDGPDEWAKYWISSNHCSHVRVRHQQGRRRVMFWPAITDDGSIRPFRIENGVTIDSRGYAFLTFSTLITWVEQNSPCPLRMKHACYAR